MEQDLTNQYNTPLNTFEQAQYDMMFDPITSSGQKYDYDMQGWFKANQDQDPHDDGAHYPDTWKKPNHPTFSDESIYHGVDGNEGGHWDLGDNGRETFVPGKTNYENFTPQQMIDYFKAVDPSSQLNLPGS